MANPESTKLEPSHLVIEVLTIMREHQVDRFPVYEDDHFLGYITREDLADFLAYRDKDSIAYQDKLNFELGDAIVIIAGLRNEKVKHAPLAKWFVAVVLLIAMGSWFYQTPHPYGVQVKAAINHLSKFKSGDRDLSLSFSNGKVIKLNASKQGVVIGDELVYNDGSALVDLDLDLEVNKEEMNHNNVLIFSIPNGKTYEVTLPDGTRVWLNAGSKLKFPASFAGIPQRKVELIGEAYFEVTKNNIQPFMVVTAKQTVTVLGTHFSISAYANEAIVKTTVLEGSVKVDCGRDTGIVVLKPNQQSVLSGSNKLQVVQVDAKDAVAWKSGKLIFRNEPLESIMRMVSRWYDVEVIYKNSEGGKQLFGGSISKSNTLQEVLDVLALTGDVHFQVEGNTVIVNIAK